MPHDPVNHQPGHVPIATAANLRELGERSFIEGVVEASLRGVPLDPSVLLSVGDDAAVVRPTPEGPPLAITIDAMVEGTHFRRDMDPAGVGYRLAVANLSDLAAMAADPWVAVLTFGAPPDLGVEWARGFFQGLREASDKFGMKLVGGDTVRSPQVLASLTLIGRMDDRLRIPHRGDARPGDTLFVTGTPGESAAGLRLELDRALADEVTPEDAEYLRQRHFRPTPRLREAKLLVGATKRCALIDVSDGVYNETELLCEASGGLGARIWWDTLPTSPALEHLAAAVGMNGRHLTLFGGEDFELLLAASAREEELRAILHAAGCDTPLRAIGQVEAEPGIRIVTDTGELLDLDPDTFAHFG